MRESTLLAQMQTLFDQVGENGENGHLPIDYYSFVRTDISPSIIIHLSPSDRGNGLMFGLTPRVSGGIHRIMSYDICTYLDSLRSDEPTS